MKGYPIRPSRTLYLASLGMYLLAGICLVLFFPLNWMSGLLWLALALSLFAGTRAYVLDCSGKVKNLFISSLDRQLSYGDDDNLQKIKSYKVYTSRNTIIIKPGAGESVNVLVLLPDSFRSRKEFLEFRYELSHINQRDNAN